LILQRLLLIASLAKKIRKLPLDDDENGPEVEYGDKKLPACGADSSDFSIHQFLAAEDGRDGPKSTDVEDQGFAMRRSQTLAEEDLFNSEKLPFYVGEYGPEFAYGDKESHARDADSPDYSFHQFLVAADARGDLQSTVDEDQGFDLRRSQAFAKEDHFNSAETPSTETYGQFASKKTQKLPFDVDENGPEFAYGGKEVHARDAHSSDYSIHQFLAAADGRDDPKSTDDEYQWVDAKQVLKLRVVEG